VLLGVFRRWAQFRGERCLSTTRGFSASLKTGEALVVGNRAYVITRVLRARVWPHGEAEWEVWGRRQTATRHT
jgi:hypothetical protein